MRIKLALSINNDKTHLTKIINLPVLPDETYFFRYTKKLSLKPKNGFIVDLDKLKDYDLLIFFEQHWAKSGLDVKTFLIGSGWIEDDFMIEG